MVLADQVGGLGEKLGFYEDLTDSDIESSFALIHQRFSTNTFPTWSLAQPFRMLCHNGEINTVRGNINWMNARHKNLASPSFSENDLNKIWPVIEEGQSDSASFDNALELLVRGGYSISEAMLIMIPEAWQNNDIMDKNLKVFMSIMHQLWSLGMAQLILPLPMANKLVHCLIETVSGQQGI